MEIPEEWRHLEDEFADQDTFDVQAQILIGADMATVFPYCELNRHDRPVKVKSCRLMRSYLTNKLIMFGACETHENSRNTTREASQVNLIRANASKSDAIVNSMNTLAISDIDPASISKKQE